MGYIRDWVASVAAVTMIVSIAQILCPKNSAGRVVGFCGAIILTAVLIYPVKKLDFNILSDYTKQLDFSLEEKAEKLDSANEKMRRDIIEEQTAAYIFQRAEALDIECSVIVKCKGDVPYSVCVKSKDEQSFGKVQRIIEEECGIPPERQTYEIEV